ncbi:elongator complex protein 5 [Chrysoperla carnea]|uniref:elongator complex protein 5 n=1 Tax=Chrysoperla carnea TaxID=189513 RepID=UPI001D075FAA|nr:elongator complex protein 5 [Chrysoperla carnea]
MFSQAIFGKPLPKFVLIQDTYETKQTKLVESIVHMHNVQSVPKVYIFSFENQLEFVRSPKIQFQTYTDTSNLNSILPICLDHITEECILIIDSLIDLIYVFGEGFCVQEIQKLLRNKLILQIITVLHTDVLYNELIPKYFTFLSTLNIVAKSSDVIEYTHKRLNGKVIKKLVKLSYNNRVLTSKEIELNDLLQSESIPYQPNPDKLTTFKIGLEENEIESRNKLVLPYLKTEENKGKPQVTIGDNSGGKILYLPDEYDDFDEEDPDDDLDV